MARNLVRLLALYGLVGCHTGGGLAPRRPEPMDFIEAGPGITDGLTGAWRGDVEPSSHRGGPPYGALVEELCTAEGAEAHLSIATTGPYLCIVYDRTSAVPVPIPDPTCLSATSGFFALTGELRAGDLRLELEGWVEVTSEDYIMPFSPEVTGFREVLVGFYSNNGGGRDQISVDWKRQVAEGEESCDLWMNPTFSLPDRRLWP